MSTVIYRKEGHIARVILNRPEARNALSHAMVVDLEKTLSEVSADEDIYVVVLSAAGEKAFSAGFDLKESVGNPIINVPERRENTDWELNTWRKIWHMPKPVIAQVQGYCIGGALHLALMCDLIIASDDAKFGEPELAYSYIPDILIEPWKMPFNIAREILYLGEFKSADELHRVGVVNKVVPFDQLEKTTMEVAHRLEEMPRDATRMLKQQINKTYEIMGIHNAMDYAAEMFNLCRINQAQAEADFNEIVNSRGLKAALEWKEEQKKQK